MPSKKKATCLRPWCGVERLCSDCALAPDPDPDPVPESKMPYPDVTAERQAVYGPTGINFEAFGKAVTALLEMHYQIRLPHALPPHVAAHIYTVGKVLRAVAPFKYNADNAVDAHNYIAIAEELDKRRPNPLVGAVINVPPGSTTVLPVRS